MNIFFEHWHFNNNNLPLLHIPSLKDCPHDLRKYESKRNLKIPIFELFSELGEIWKYTLS